MRSWREVGGRAFRTVMSLFLLFHLSAMMLSVGRDVHVAGDLRATLTRTYEKTIGVHQNWTMFVPNPGTSTIWLEATGFRGAEKEPVATLFGEPDPHGTIWLYERANKYERNLAGKERKAMRAGMVRWLCANAKEAGTPYQEIEFSRASKRTPKPAARAAAGPRETWPIERTQLERWRCKP
jgi:hypothetical protein